MEDKQKAECLIELCKTQMDHFRQTRNIEFKINLALWTLIVLGGKFLYCKVKLLDPWYGWIIYLLSALVIVLFHLCWMVSIQNSEDKDDHYINQYRSIVEELGGVNLKKIEFQKPKLLPKWLWPSRRSWIFLETGITGMLLIVIFFILLK